MPSRREPSHTIAKLSEPRPLLHGSVRAITAAAAIAASTAVPPWRSMCNPAWAASGWLGATMLRANTGVRGVGYRLVQSNMARLESAACRDPGRNVIRELGPKATAQDG